MNKRAEFLPADVVEVEFDDDDKKDDQTDAEKRTDAFADALADDDRAFVNVSRQLLGGNSPMEFVARYPADKYDIGELLSHLQSTYGPGDYRVMLYAKGKLRQNKMYTIAAPKGMAAFGHTEGGQGKGELSQSLEVIMRAIQQQQSAIMELANKRDDPLANIERLLQLKALFSDDTPKVNGMSQLKESMEVMKMMGVEFGGSAEKEEGFGDLIEKLTPAIEAAVKMPQTGYKQNPDPRGDKNMFQKMLLQQWLKQLYKAATQQTDPGAFAEVIVGQFPPDKIKEFFTSGQAVDKLFELKPELKNYKEWLDLLAEHLKAQLGMESTVGDLYDDIEGEVSPVKGDAETDPKTA
jgi:hypothetical protein